MAGEDFLIVGGLDLSRVRAELKTFQRELNSLQSAAVGSGAKLPVLPPAALQRLNSPNVAGIAKGDSAAIKAAVRSQAELVALKLQELNVNKKILSGGAQSVGLDSKTAKQLRKGAVASLESELGFALSPAQKAELTRSVKQLFNKIEAEIASVPVAGQAAALRSNQTVKKTLTAQGLGGITVSDADTLARKQEAGLAKAQRKYEKANPILGPGRDQLVAIEAEILKAKQETAAAVKQRAALEKKAAARYKEEYPVLGPTRKDMPTAKNRAAQSAKERADLEKLAAQRYREEYPILGPGPSQRKVADRYLKENPVLGPGKAEEGKAKLAILREQEKIAAAAAREAKAARKNAEKEEERAAKKAAQAVKGSPEARDEAAEKTRKAKAGSARDTALTSDPGLEGQYVTATAELTVLRQRLAALVAVQIEADATYAANTAQLATARNRLAIATNQQILNDPAALAALNERGVSTKEVKAAAATAQTADPALSARATKAEIDLILARNLAAAALKTEAAASVPVVESEVAKKLANTLNANAVLEETLASEQLTAELRRQRALQSQLRTATGGATAAQPQPRGFINRIKGIGSGTGGAGDFFGAGFATTLKYALPSAALFGAFSGISDAVKDSEELAVSFTKIDSQMEHLNDPDRLANMKSQIIDLSKESGIAAAELADVALQLQGAFGDIKPEDGLKGSDGIARSGQDLVDKQIEAANQISLVTGIAQAELTDGLTAAAFAFDASFDRVGDVATKLETATGVKAKETISFLGDIGPSAKEAGFELEEMAAIAAQVQKRSGQSGATIAEQMTRIFAAISGNSQDFFAIADKNRDLFGEKGYAEFIKNIQQADTKGIFQQLSGVFDDLDKGSKQFIVNLIGGQRQANTLLAAFGDQEGLEKLTKDAKDAAGTLEERYEKLRGRISVILKQLKASFNEFVKGLIDAGIGEAVAGILTGFKAIFNVVSSGLTILGKMNDLLGGAGSKITAMLLQLLLFKAAMTQIAKLQIGSALAGGVSGGRGLTGLPAVTGGRGFFPGTRIAYRDALSRQVGPEFRASQNLTRANIPLPLGVSGPVSPGSISQLSKIAGPAAKLKAAASGFSALLGGPVGVGFLAITALSSGYQYFTDKINKDREATKKFRETIRSTNKSVEDLQKLAKQYRDSDKDRSSITRVADFISQRQSKADLVDIELARRQNAEAIKDLVAANNEDTELINALVTKYNVKSENKPKAVTVEIPGLGGGAAINDLLSSRDEIDFTQKFKKGDSAFANQALVVQKYLENIGIKNREAISGQVAGILYFSENVVGDLQKLAEETTDKDVRDQIYEVLKAIDVTVKADSKGKDLLSKIRRPETTLKNLTGEGLIAGLEEFDAAYQSGSLSLSKYIAALDTNIARIKGKETISPQDRADIKAQEKTKTKLITDSILAKQEQDLEIAELLGASDEELNSLKIEQNLANLNNPGFNDKEARQKAAIAVLENTRQYYQNLVENTDDLALAQKLLNEGFDIPPEVRQALFKRDIEAADQYRDLSANVQSLRNDPKIQKVIDSISGGLDSKKGPGRILDDVLTELFNGGITADTVNSLQSEYEGLAKELVTNKSLTDNQKEDIKGTLDFIAQLLGLAGKLPTVRIKTDDNGKKLIASNQGSGGNWVTNGLGITGGAFGASAIPGKGQLKPEDAKKAADDAARVQDAMFSLAIARANGNAVLIAQYKKQQAEAQKKRAETLTGADKQVAILEAEAASVEADQEMVDAIKAITDSKFNLVKAHQEAAGDLVGSAQTDVAQAQSDLAAAKASGDAAGINNAAAALVSANQAVIEARKAERDAQAAYLKAVITKDDPVLQAQFDLNLAKIQLAEAQGTTAKAEAALRVLESERALRDAMQAANYSIYNLRQAQLQSMDDDVGVANVAVQLARQQLQDAISNGAGQAEINNLRAALITADKSARDTLFQDKLDDYQYLLDTGKITKTQYIQYLEGLKNTLAPGSKQFKDLEVTLRNLKNEIGADLQANLPTAFDLPTLYEARRLNQTGSQASATPGQSIGYQDLRQQSIQVYVTNGMNEGQVVKVLQDAIGVGRNGSQPSRY